MEKMWRSVELDSHLQNDQKTEELTCRMLAIQHQANLSSDDHRHMDDFNFSQKMTWIEFEKQKSSQAFPIKCLEFENANHLKSFQKAWPELYIYIMYIYYAYQTLSIRMN